MTELQKAPHLKATTEDSRRVNTLKVNSKK